MGSWSSQSLSVNLYAVEQALIVRWRKTPASSHTSPTRQRGWLRLTRRECLRISEGFGKKPHLGRNTEAESGAPSLARRASVRNLAIEAG